MIHVVIGTAFGDEGKGQLVDHLVRQTKSPLVIRFNGGCQAGHTVHAVTVGSDKDKHVFSHFGAGTFAGAKTYWSRFCPVNPMNLAVEEAALTVRGVRAYDKLYVDPACPVTTWFDVAANRALENQRGRDRHGSTGVGFGTTIERHYGSPIKLYAVDLLNPDLTAYKLEQIRKYYDSQGMLWNLMVKELPESSPKVAIENFMLTIGRIPWEKMIQSLEDVAPAADSVVMEGAQGILLDMDHGYFPYVTRSNTTSKNAMQLIRETEALQGHRVTIEYVSRTFMTRHGAGPLPAHPVSLVVTDLMDTTNVNNPWQGSQRVCSLDPKVLDQALKIDQMYCGTAKRNLSLTWCDKVAFNATVSVPVKRRAHTPVGFDG